MKTPKIISLLLIVALLLVFVAGCAASESNGTMTKAPVADNLSGESVENAPESAVAANRKLIREIYLDAETEDMDALLDQVADRVNALGGYIQERSVQNGSAYGGSSQRYATLIIRIPAEKLDAFVTDVDGISNIVSNTETTEDVTLQYNDIESRLRVLRAEEERLLAFLAEAETVAEMVQIETRLTEVLSEIDKLTSQQKLYDNLVDYGTVTLSVEEVEQYTAKTQPGFWERIGSGFVSSVENVGKILQGLLIFFVCSIPYLVPALIIGGAVLLIVKRCNRKKKKD